MRLGQLSRKLSLRQGEIVVFLAEKGITIEDGSNTRIDDRYVTMVLEKFAPARLTEILQEPDESEPLTAPVSAALPIVAVVPETVSEAPPAVIESEEQKPDVIKATKVELPGLKVLGKIEFPEPKKKPVEQPSPNDQPSLEEKPVRPERSEPRREQRRREQPRFDRQDQRPRKSPIVLQRELEAEEAQARRMEESERKKELKKLHYHKKVKPVAPTKAARLIDEEMEVADGSTETKPKTMLGRFFRWLKS